MADDCLPRNFIHRCLKKQRSFAYFEPLQDVASTQMREFVLSVEETIATRATHSLNRWENAPHELGHCMLSTYTLHINMGMYIHIKS